MTTPSPEPRIGDRIAKLLARAGVASRREVERMIEDGRIAIDGMPVATPATVLTSLEGVTVDGRPVQAPEPTRLFLYHKPAGLLVTERDPRGRPTIYDRLPEDLPRVVPVGRLDLATEGLLLLTTDGGLKRQLELPATGVERAYRARAYGQVTQTQLEALSEGIEIDGIRYGSIDANIERRTGANVWIEMTLTEGKNREVRRVLEHLGLQVSRLIRIRYGPFVVGELEPGQIGEVKASDLEAFRKSLARAPALPASLDVPNAPVAAPVSVEARRAPSPVRASRPIRDGARLARTGGATAREPDQARRVTAPRPPRPRTDTPPPTTTAEATPAIARPYAKPGVNRRPHDERTGRGADATALERGRANARGAARFDRSERRPGSSSQGTAGERGERYPAQGHDDRKKGSKRPARATDKPRGAPAGVRPSRTPGDHPAQPPRGSRGPRGGKR